MNLLNPTQKQKSTKSDRQGLTRGLNPTILHQLQVIKDRGKREDFLRHQAKAQTFVNQSLKRGLIGVEVGEHYKRKDQVFLTQNELNFHRFSNPKTTYEFVFNAFTHAWEYGSGNYLREHILKWLSNGRLVDNDTLFLFWKEL